MVWNSIVGKLWITIIGLVAVVLTLLSLLLVQFLDGYYLEQRTDNLKKLAVQLTKTIEATPDSEHIQTAKEMVEAYNTNLLVVGLKEGSINAVDQGLPQVPSNLLTEHPVLKKALEGEVGVVRGRFPVLQPPMQNEIGEKEILAVSVPLHTKEGTNGAIILYQNLQDMTETTKETTKYILYAAAISIFLTTIFAFFLSTRITNPLRQMTKAADSISRGNFDTIITIKSGDEIGELASTFNRMAKQLDELIHALSREKDQLFSVLRSMVDGVITVDKSGEILIINPPAEEMLKALKFESSGKEWGSKDSLIGLQPPEPFVTYSKEVVETEHESVIDITAQGRVWSVVLAPLYDRNQVSGVVAVLRDMTKERQLDKLRKDFIANVSHELRTPLAMLQGYSEAIVDDIAVSPEETKELAQIIYDESVRMSRLVNELLDLGRMEAGHIELNRKQVEILPIFDKIIRKFSVVGNEQKITVIPEFMLMPEAQFSLDADRIEQVFTNLIDNAIRHTHADGKVFVSTMIKDDQLFIEVRDTGTGIPEEDLPFVFERFYKADKARTRSRSGTGLGLSIVKQIVAAHGGQISVHSKLGEGTTFSITIPNEHQD
ncbi:ATP-binding protein [Ammoniphilus resinae]|uniref:histidine kinase n=1 Tax=Ammoniphilus resinae TaxID=861532 RepID=A0ABS4GTD2_9BACL|nr:ATP-binding protein [Ammoniphilus resinae]MBP1933506.1 two-component system sensor histidine kinase ResE [Ammoniphilus resinae]